MARVIVRDVGQYGVITDLPAQELPPEAWTSVSGVRFDEKQAQDALGENEEVFGTFSAQPYKLFPVAETTNGYTYWVYCGLDDIYAITPAGPPATHTNITRAAGVYTGTATDRWNACWLNGIVIFNNGVDKPQLWSSINTAVDLVDLTNWPSTWRAKVVKPYKNFLIALNILKSTTRYPTLVSWSHPADPGSAPSSWDITDTTKLTGDFPLSQTSGALVDCLGLRDANVIYKEDAVILQQYVGGQDIFAWRDISLTAGLAAQGCMVEFRPGYHVFLTPDLDVCVCNGQTIESVADSKVRSDLKAIGWYYLDTSFAFAHPTNTEVYFCVGSGVSDAKSVFIWNWRTGAWGRGADVTWLDAVAGDYQTTWADLKQPKVLFAKSSQLKGYSLGAITATSALWRDGLAVIGQGRDGSPRVDYNVHKVVTEVWPQIEAPPGTEVQITIDATNDSMDFANSPGANAQTLSFICGTDTKVDCLVEGRYINIGFDFIDTSNWKFHGYSLEMNVVGEYA